MATDGHGIRRGQDGLHTWLRRENGLPGDGDVVASHLVPVVRACDAWQPLVQLHLTIRDGKHVPLLSCRHFPVLLDVVEVHDAHLFLQRLSGAIQVSRHDDARRRLALRRGRGCRSPLALSFVHQLPPSRPVPSCHTTTAASPAGGGVTWGGVGVGWGNDRHRFWAQALFSSACLHVAFSCHRQRPLLSQHSRATARSLPAERRRCLRQPEGQSTSEQCLLKAKSSWGVQPDRGQEAGSGPGSARPRPGLGGSRRRGSWRRGSRSRMRYGARTWRMRYGAETWRSCGWTWRALGWTWRSLTFVLTFAAVARLTRAAHSSGGRSHPVGGVQSSEQDRPQ